MPDSTKIKTRCPHCGATFKVAEKHIGKVAKCPTEACGQKFKVHPYTPAPTKPKPAVESTAVEAPAVESLEDSDNPFLDTIPVAPLPATGATMMEGTYASNPGSLKVNPVRWALCKPKWPVALGLLLAISVTLVSLFPGFLTGLALLFSGAINFHYWRRVRDHFRYGDVNPGLVISLEPTLVAVSTDLTMGEGEFPVIKIIECNLTQSAGEPLQVGSCLPTVALYAHPDNEDDLHWADFHPQPADYASGNHNALREMLATFDPRQLQQLTTDLKNIAQPYEAGLYLLWPEPGKQIGRRAQTT